MREGDRWGTAHGTTSVSEFLKEHLAVNNIVGVLEVDREDDNHAVAFLLDVEGFVVAVWKGDDGRCRTLALHGIEGRLKGN